MCFSLQWVESLLIWLVVLVAVVSILRLFVPWVLAQLGIDSGMLMRIINIGIWAIVLIALIVFVFDLLSCLMGGGGMPRLYR